jgi:hypothetical protein
LALQYSHTPSTGILFSRLTILNLRFAMPKFPRERTRLLSCGNSNCTTAAPRNSRRTIAITPMT